MNIAGGDLDITTNDNTGNIELISNNYIVINTKDIYLCSPNNGTSDLASCYKINIASDGLFKYNNSPIDLTNGSVESDKGFNIDANRLFSNDNHIEVVPANGFVKASASKIVFYNDTDNLYYDLYGTPCVDSTLLDINGSQLSISDNKFEHHSITNYNLIIGEGTHPPTENSKIVLGTKFNGSDFLFNFNDTNIIISSSSSGSTIYTVYLMDSFGDGWNGGTISIQNVVTLAYVIQDVFLHETLSVSSFNITLNDGNYQVIVTDGLYPSEISWRVDDNLGAMVTSGGAPYNDQFTIGGGGGGGGGGEGEGEGGSTINTYNLNLYDSFGDGWNGGTITIMDTQNNSYVIDNETLTDGSSITLQIQLDTTITYSIDVTNSVYPAEISWNIHDTSENELISGVAPTNVNFIPT